MNVEKIRVSFASTIHRHPEGVDSISWKCRDGKFLTAGSGVICTSDADTGDLLETLKEMQENALRFRICDSSNNMIRWVTSAERHGIHWGDSGKVICNPERFHAALDGQLIRANRMKDVATAASLPASKMRPPQGTPGTPIVLGANQSPENQPEQDSSGPSIASDLKLPDWQRFRKKFR